jgi:hypothetical protein
VRDSGDFVGVAYEKTGHGFCDGLLGRSQFDSTMRASISCKFLSAIGLCCWDAMNPILCKAKYIACLATAGPCYMLFGSQLVLLD